MRPAPHFLPSATPQEIQAQQLARREWALVYQLGHLLLAISKGAFVKLGYGHLSAFLKEVLDISSSSARRWMDLAAGLDRYPILRQSFAAGRICPSKFELLLSVLKRRPGEEAERVHQAERLSVRALRHAFAADLEEEPDLVYFSCEMDEAQTLSWREARDTVRALLEAQVPRGEILEYAVAEFLSGQERVGYEEVLMPPSRSERQYPLAVQQILPVDLTPPELPSTPLGLQEAALELMRKRHQVALEQGELLVELVMLWRRRGAVGQFAEAHLALSRTTAYKRMRLAEGCRRHHRLAQLSCERACLLLPLLDAGLYAVGWIEFAGTISVDDLERWVRHLKWQLTFRFEEFLNWAWRAPNPGEKPPEPHRLGALPTLAQRPLDVSLSLATRSAVQVLEIEHPRAGLDELLRPVQVLENGPTRRLGWMVPRDFYPLLAEGIDLASEGLFFQVGQSLKTMLDEFVRIYRLRSHGRRDRIRKRDRHRCQAPGCTGCGKLHVHHIKFRSQGGGEEAWNKVLVCAACHRLIHVEGTLKVYGQAPDDLVWIRPYERWEKGRRVKLREPAVA